MKKIFGVFIVFALVFVACPTDDENNGDNSDVIGVWTGSYSYRSSTGTLTLDIADGTWVMVFSDSDGPLTENGKWTRDANTLKLNSWATASLYEGKLFLTQSIYSNRPTNITLTKKVETPPVPPSTTFLKIKNESFIEITDVIWNNVTFTGTIRTGTSMTKAAQAGSGYIYFKRQGNPIAARTNTFIVVEADTEKEFVFTNNTIIAEVSNPGNNETLETFYTKPWIVVKQNTAIITQNGEYNFGSILAGTEKDITFTIENIGGGNLVFENVNGSRVNLEDNTSEYFSIIQQPLIAAVTPGNTIPFTVRFNPQTIGNNYSAVHIKTNSQNAQEFAFSIKGSGRNYIIGDTGAGGGLIFSVEGSRFLECSGELGINDWNGAIQVAQDYNGGGFTDWYLPTLGELQLMYQNLHSKGLGGFYSKNYTADSCYWSSTLYSSSNSVLYFSFYTGGNSYSSPSYSYRVRAVRAFSF